MKGRLIDLSLGLNRKQRITVEVDEDFRNEFDHLKDIELSVDIKKYRNRRSLDANAYAWVLMDKLSAALRIKRTELYRQLIREIGGNNETVCVMDSSADKLRKGWEHNGLGWVTDIIPSKIDGCTNVILYYGSSTYDTQQMSRLIDLIVQECRQQGIDTATPKEIDLMMARFADG